MDFNVAVVINRPSMNYESSGQIAPIISASVLIIFRRKRVMTECEALSLPS